MHAKVQHAELGAACRAQLPVPRVRVVSRIQTKSDKVITSASSEQKHRRMHRLVLLVQICASSCKL